MNFTYSKEEQLYIALLNRIPRANANPNILWIEPAETDGGGLDGHFSAEYRQSLLEHYKALKKNKIN